LLSPSHITVRIARERSVFVYIGSYNARPVTNMAFLRPQPANLRERIRGMTRREWLFALASAGVTAIVMIGFLVESRWGYLPPPPRIVYFESWPATEMEAAAIQQAQARAAKRAAPVRKPEVAPTPASE